MALTSTLPGITFEPAAAPADESLPRMDVCGFVGFASSGPINVPVLVEDAVRFRDVFGVDPILARSSDGTAVTAHLGPAVEAFFANGGARAWVVRVAQTVADGDGIGEATLNEFMIPGLIVPGNRGGTLVGWRMATIGARSAGAWSDSLRVGARLAVRSAVISGFGDDHVLVGDGIEVDRHDLLRLVIGDGLSALVPVSQVTASEVGRRVIFAPAQGWLVDEGLDLAGHPIGAPSALTEAGPESLAPSNLTLEVSEAGVARIAVDAGITLTMNQVVGFDAAPSDTGITLVWIGEEIFDPDAPDDGRLRFSVKRAMTVSPLSPTWSTDPTTMPIGAVIAETLRLDLIVAEGERTHSSLIGLGLHPDHQRSLASLPIDEEMFARVADIPRTVTPPSPSASIADFARHAFSDLEREVLQPRFPLAAIDDTLMLPLVLSTAPGEEIFGPPPAASEAVHAPIRNGLRSFDAGLFVDPELAGLSADTVVSTAYHLAFVADRPRSLKGMHALVPLDEVTLVVVPDAVHTGWEDIEVTAPPPLAAPVLEAPFSMKVEAGPVIRLTWSDVPGADRYELIESADPTLDFPKVFESDEPTLQLDDVPSCPEARFYRVRALRGIEQGPWSNVTAGYVPFEDFTPCRSPEIPTDLASAEPMSPPDPSTVAWRAKRAEQAAPWNELRAIHAALLRWAAARGDMFALISLPESFTAADGGAYARWLTGLGSEFDGFGSEASPAFLSAGIPSLTSGESELVRVAALYHPWVIAGLNQVGIGLRPHPPDGAMAGVFARRSLDRGAWIAPANVPLNGAIGLEPTLTDGDRMAFLNASINPVGPDPRGFMALSARTLSTAAGTRQVNVRRLLQLLRRLAIREGMTDVFRPNDEQFRSLVRMRFERLLTDLFERGAFAGATATEAFEVYTGDVVNPEGSRDLGRFVVEIRVAPSVPMEFITVRLLLSAGSGPTVEGN